MKFSREEVVVKFEGKKRQHPSPGFSILTFTPHNMSLRNFPSQSQNLDISINRNQRYQNSHKVEIVEYHVFLELCIMG